MANSVRGLGSDRFFSRLGTTTARRGLVCLVAMLLSATFALAHSPNVDSSLSDWCVGAFSNTATGGGRVEDSAASLTCGNCSLQTGLACVNDADCAIAVGGLDGTCVLGTKTEEAWWDNRTDGAVNDLATFAITQDATNLYLAAELWVDPDPVSLPFAEVGIDFKQGGVAQWHDPLGNVTAAGRCSVSTDRACTSNADCSFCVTSTESTGICSETPSDYCVNNTNCVGATNVCDKRIRTVGSACDAGDAPDTPQTCVGLGTKPKDGVGSDCLAKPDLLLVFDFGVWLIQYDVENAVLLMEPGTVLDPTSPWDEVRGCAFGPNEPNLDDPTDRCDFVPLVNPGASGGSGGPPGAVEVAIPWSAFEGTGFGPGVPFRFTVTVVRGTLTLDFRPDGAIEDVFSEAVAHATTLTTDSCAGFGAGNTDCEMGNDSTDAFIPLTPPLAHELAPGGRIAGLTVSKNLPNITLDWFGSCSSADTDYEVYEGTIGTWYSHALLPTWCTTAGATSALLTNAGAGSTYYLVVPSSGATEGSYGLDNNGVPSERPVGAPSCAGQLIGTCP